MALRAYVKTLCGPLWWESSRQTVVNSGSMCVVKTTERLFGISNHHVLMSVDGQLGGLETLCLKFSRVSSGIIEKTDHVVYGGYPESLRRVPPGPNPLTMTADFVSFLGTPNNCSAEHISFQVNPKELTWLPNVEKPLEPGANLSGMSGGACFRLVPAEDRIELAGITYEGYWEEGIIFAR